MALRAGSGGVRIAWRRIGPQRAKDAASASMDGVGKGDKVPLLMVHGFGCGMGDWGALPQLLADRGGREVAVFDHRGVGESDVPPGPYTIADLTKDAVSILDAANWPKAHVLGISMGGMVAQNLAIDTPNRVSGLVLGCTTHGGRLSTPPPPDFIDTCRSWTDGDPAAQHRFADKFLDFNLPKEWDSLPGGARLRSQMLDRFLETSRSEEGLAGQFSALSRFSSLKNLPSIQSPTLVVHGDQDQVVPPANGDSLAGHIPGARMLSWPGAGHFWWVVRPLDVVEKLGEFLEDCDAAV